MKVKCRTCDICGKQMEDFSLQFRIRMPRVRFGFPDIGLKRYDVCDECFAELSVIILEKKKEKES